MDVMMRCRRWAARVGAGLLSLAVSGAIAGAAADTSEVVIGPTDLRPAVLKTSLNRTVLFRNLSQRPFDVAFLGYAGMHHVSERGPHITVVFHAAGRHAYVVRFADSDAGHLHGAVEVAETPEEPAAAELPVCTGITVSGLCYAR